MSIINQSYPPDYTSIQDQLWVVVESDNYEQVNFKYIFDVYNTDTNQQLIRAKIYPDVTSGMGYFDVGSVVRNCMTYNWFFPYDSIGVSVPNIFGQIGLQYRIEIGEEYNVGASGIQEINITDNTTVSLNYTPTVDDRRLFDILDYTNKYLTTRELPDSITLRRDEPFFIGYLGDFAGSASVGYYVETDADDYDSTSSSTSRFHQFNIGPAAVTAETGIIYSNTEWYDIMIPYPDGKTIRVYIDDCPTLHDPYYLVFMNRFGMFDTAAFKCVSKFNMTVGRKAYETKEAKFDGLDVNYYTDSGLITMDYPTDADYNWLSELVYSPQVYLKIGGDYFPVTIKNTNYEELKRIYAGLKTFEIEVERNTKLNGFRR